ncbi:MAG: Ig-like domain-containing protein [Pseudomonadota bacterium]|nr:Ig-like domain-containing protein [Pseudomonadota bacterium]
MKVGRLRSWAALGTFSFAVGCAGNGQGLDQNGQPIASGSSSGGAVTADFKSIQDNVFTPICSKCHIGASAPEGLQLDAAHSYNLLVGVPSAERPSLLRVKAGDPNNSYMVLKIEGAAGIDGAQMPFGETPLPQATIDAIRQWVTNGAPNAPTATASAFAVQSTAPAHTAILTAPVKRIVVTFTQEVDASLINESTLSVERIAEPPDPESTAASLGTQRSAISSTVAASNPAVVLITPAAPLAAGTYRVTVRGTGGGAVANLQAATLGADHSFEFTVEPTR